MGAQTIRRKRRRCTSSNGQALLEFAIALPVLLILGLGIIEIGRFAYISILVGNAARAGATYGAQNRNLSGDSNGIAQAARADFAGVASGTDTNNGLLASTLSVNSFPTCSCDNAGTLSPAPTTNYCAGPPTGTNNNAGSCSSGHWVIIVNVTASGNFTSLFSYPGLPSSLPVSRTASMRVAQN